MPKRKQSKKQNEVEENDLPSKSQVKRDFLELQKLGLKLSSLPISQLKKIELTEKLYDAIILSHTIHSNSASKRHRQYIGKIISKLEDDELQKIRDKINAFEETSQQANKHFHQLENYRDQILKQGDQVINILLSKYENLDRSRLRQLHRNAAKERDKQQPPKSAKLLFQYLKENISRID
jgi:ribosome-associated protein